MNRDSSIYLPSELRWKLSLIARARNQSINPLKENIGTADSVACELLEEAIARRWPQFAAACAEQEDRNKKLMEMIAHDAFRQAEAMIKKGAE